MLRLEVNNKNNTGFSFDTIETFKNRNVGENEGRK
jgi:hypothetical protein